jgi:hypothetical protein
MQMRILSAVLAVGCLALLAMPAMGDPLTWTYEGSSSFKAFNGTYPTVGSTGVLARPVPAVEGYAPHPLGDMRRVRYNAMVVDLEGRVYAACTHFNNSETTAGHGGGVTIFDPSTNPMTITNVDLTSRTPALMGAVMKLVVAGDHKVYGVQNWYESVGSGVPGGTTSRILRFNPNGSVDVIQDYTPAVLGSDNYTWVNRIGGLTVGADGNPYWWFAGQTQGTSNGYWKTHVLWRYNIAGNAVQEFPLATTDPQGTDGGENGTRMLNFEYIGTGNAGDSDSYFAVMVLGIPANGNVWTMDAIRWNSHRIVNIPNGQNPADSWGHDYFFATAYDKENKQLWMGGRGTGYGGSTAESQGSNVMSVWYGTAGNAGLLAKDSSGNVSGVAGNLPFHTNNNDPKTTGVGNGGPYWVTSLAINAGDGAAWYGFAGAILNGQKPIDGNYSYTGDWGKVGHVYSVRLVRSPIEVVRGDYGRPQDYHTNTAVRVDENAVEAVAFSNADSSGSSKVYALVADLVNGDYNLYSAINPVTATPGACCMQSGCLAADSEHCIGEFQGVGTLCSQVDCSCRTCHDPFADADGDGDVDQTDFAIFQACFTGPDVALVNSPCRCDCYDRTGPDGVPDTHVDSLDFSAWMNCASGPGIMADKNCDNVVVP